MTSDADQRIENHIEALVAEEHELLRQRRAHEDFGLDPDNTSMRGPGTVEGYEG